MKNVVCIKSVKTESPKTPGGISKSLLTPCRRIGLSRNYKKVGPAPFISPLSGSNSTVETKVEKKEPRKRKKSVESEENKEESRSTQSSNEDTVDVDEADTIKSTVGENDLSSTPTCHIEVPRKKKSKKLLSALNKIHVEDIAQNQTNETVTSDVICGDKNITETKDIKLNYIVDVVIPVAKSRSKLKNIISPQNTPKTTKENINKQTNAQGNAHNAEKQVTNVQEKDIATPLQKSKSGNKKMTSPKNSTEPSKEKDHEENVIDLQKENECKDTTEYVIKPRSPNDLTKECIVVLQKKMFKTDKIASKKKAKNNLNTQILDSDSDDIPLGQLNKEKADCHKIEEPETQIKEQSNTQVQEIITLDDEEDFTEKKKSKVKKLEDKATSIGGLQKKPKNTKSVPQKPIKPLKTSDFDDEDDFDFENKRTILIRKTYEKVNKPQKAKSTGSITQADINELKARIEAKKKLLLAKTMTEDTEELRSLIKRWQKGCQDALMELMELMKDKFPDKQNMDYSEMLKMLKIPFNLVGYDEEDDCFSTPDDTGNILSKFNDL